MPGCLVSAEFLCNAIVMQQERMSFTHTRSNSLDFNLHFVVPRIPLLK